MGKRPVVPGSSAVEPPAVNRAVASSNLALGANPYTSVAFEAAEIPRTDVAAGGNSDVIVLNIRAAVDIDAVRSAAKARMLR